MSQSDSTLLPDGSQKPLSRIESLVQRLLEHGEKCDRPLHREAAEALWRLENNRKEWEARFRSLPSTEQSNGETSDGNLQLGDFTIQQRHWGTYVAIEDRWWKFSELRTIIREWNQKNAEQAYREVTEDMIDRALGVHWQHADNDGRNAMRAALEAALNG